MKIETEDIEENGATLLRNAIDSGKSSLITRLYRHKDKIFSMIVDLATFDDDHEKIRDLLCDAAITPSLLKSDDGKKFLSSLFGVIDTDFLHSAAKNALIKGNRITGGHWGDVYYRAWKNADDQLRLDIEACIQDLCYLVILCQQTNIVLNLRSMVKKLAEQKHTRLVEIMLAQAVMPILWRNLEVPNSHVRLNASFILFLLYPIRDDSLSPPKRRELIDKQLKHMHDLLEDDHPPVRAMAVLETCKILRKYWTTTPIEDVKQFMVTLVDKLAKDITSVDVRVNVYLGLKVLTSECNAALEAMKLLLPKVLRFGLNDLSDRVRLAAVNLLLSLKGHRFIKFWDVADVRKELVPRLSVETSRQVSKGLVRLMLWSYFPPNKDDASLVRSIDLVGISTNAARVFHIYASDLLPIADAVNHVIAILMYVFRRGRSSADSDTESNCSATTTIELANNAIFDAELTTISGLIDCASIMWTNIRPKMIKLENAQLCAKLHRIATRVLPSSITFYKVSSCLEMTSDCAETSFLLSQNSRIAQTLLYLSSLLPESDMIYLSKSVMKRLRISDDDDPHDQLLERALIEAASAWRLPDLVQLLRTSLENGLKKMHDCQAMNKTELSKSPSRKKVKFSSIDSDRDEPRFSRVLHYLTTMLASPTARQRLLDEYAHLLPLLSDSLSSTRRWIECHFDGHSTVSPSVSMIDLGLCFRLQFDLSILIALNMPDQRQSILSWLCEQAIWMRDWVIDRLDDGESVQVVLDLCKTLLRGFRSALLSGLRSDSFEQSLSTVLLILLDHDQSLSLLVQIVDTVTDLANSILFGARQDRLIDVVCPVLKCLIRFLVHTLGGVEQDKLDEKQTVDLCAKSFQDALLNVCCRVRPEIATKCSQNVLFTLTGACFSNLNSVISHNATVDDPRDADFVCPHLVRFLILKVVAKNKPLIQGVSACLLDWVELADFSLDQHPLYRFGAAAQLMRMLTAKQSDNPFLKRCGQLLHDRLNSLDKRLHQDDMFDQVQALF